jgi:hypothetical protein
MDRRAFYRYESPNVVVNVRSDDNTPIPHGDLLLDIGDELTLRRSLDATTGRTERHVGFSVPLVCVKAGAYAVKARFVTATEEMVSESKVVTTVHRPNPNRLMVWLWGGSGSKWYRDHGFTTGAGPGWGSGYTAEKWVRTLDDGLLARADVGIRPNGGLRDIDPTELDDPDAKNLGIESHEKKPVANPFHPEVARLQDQYNWALMEYVQHFPQIKTAFFNTEIVDGLETNRNVAGLALMEETLGTTERPKGGPKWIEKGVLADDDPQYMYWKYHYTRGNGLALANRRTADMVHRYRPDIFTINDPYREAGYLDMFPGVDVVSTWTYTNPDPKMMLYIESLRAACGRSAALPMHTVTLLNYPGQLAPTEDWMLMGPARTKVTTWINLSRAPKMLGYYYSSACDPQQGDSFNVPYATSETIRDLSEQVFRPLGPFFTQADIAPRKIAVLSSMASGIHGTSPNLLGHYRNLQIYQFYILLAMNHLNADVVLDETIERHGLYDYDVLVLAKCDALTETAYAQIREFQQRGGIVVADQYLAADLPDVLRFDFDFTYRKKVSANAIAKNVDFSQWNDQLQPDSAAVHEVVGVTALDDQRIMEAYAARLKAGLAGAVEASVYCDTPRVMLNQLEKDGAQYLVLINDNRAYGERAGAKFKAVLDKLLPVETTVTLRDWRFKTLVAYDMLNQRSLKVTHDGAVWQFPVSLGEIGGTVVALYPEPGASLRIGVPPAVRIGETAMLNVLLEDANGLPLAGLQPIQITLVDSEGGTTPYSDFYCARNGHLALPFVAGLNDAKGEWTIQVHDLTFGLRTERRYIVH